jgi:cytochrome c
MDQIIPRDLLLPLPAPFWLLVALLLISFALHILFVNLTVGASILVLWSEIRGLKNQAWDELSHRIAATITVNKSMAVVLGVAPLLTISVLYTVQFYSANTLLGHAWLMVIPLVILAFLFSYAHKYSWDHLRANKGVHISLAAFATLLFLAIPLIFLANINLMLYPEHWRGVDSFWKALWLPNALPRYFHFLAASLALTGLFLAYYFQRHGEFPVGDLEREEAVRSFYGVVFGATAAQILLGLLVFLTLPAHAVSVSLLAILTLVLVLAGVALLWLWRELRADRPGRRFWPIVASLSAIVVLMVWARHDVRETAIEPHRAAVYAKTEDYRLRVMAARDFLTIPGGLGGAPASPGALVFMRRCASCHAFDRKLVGPPLNEVLPPYQNDPRSLMTWIVRPGRRRTEYPVMPPQELPEQELQQVVEYLVKGS